MAMNYEFERHIQAAQEANNIQGVKALKSLHEQYRILASNGIVPVLSREENGPKTDSKESAGLPDDTTFSDLLKSFRTQNGLSQSRLAGQANVDVSPISRLERGSYKTPRAATIRKICVGLGFSPEDQSAILLTEKADRMRREAQHKS